MNYFTGGTPLRQHLQGRPDTGSTPPMPAHMGGMQRGFRGGMFTGGTPLQGGWQPQSPQWGAMPQPQINTQPQQAGGWQPHPALINMLSALNGLTRQNALAGFLALAMGLLAGGCASTKPAQYTFVAPSVAPLKHAVGSVEHRIQGATDAAKKLDEACKVKSEGWADAYASLQDELRQAQVGLATAQDLADTLQHEADAQAELGNKVARERDAALEREVKAKAIATKRLTRCWMLGGIVAALGVRTFRKPLLTLAGI